MMAALHKIPGIQLDELLNGLVVLNEKLDCTIQRLVLDSRIVQAGDLFIAVPGYQVDGRKFIDDAITNSASAILWQSEQESIPIPITWRSTPDNHDVPLIAIENLKDLVGVIADRFYEQPSKSMYTVGVTGTNGKTSCSQFIAQAIAPKMKCGVIGTMGWGFLDNMQESTHTTPDAITCHEWLADMKNAGAKAVAMEVSSHALDQGRVNSVHFDCSVFTNLSHEHLDYHGDMQAYGSAKARLFNWESVTQCIINQDDEFGRQLLSGINDKDEIVTYGLQCDVEKPDLYANNIYYHKDGITADIHAFSHKAKINSQLYGRFNIYNLLATLGVCLHAGMDFVTAIQQLNHIRPVKGRMQVIHHDKRPVIIIDYAHTPDALEQALAALKAHQFGNIWCVFGCGGDRDRAKRPRMGAIAEQLSDHVVLTNDNPRHERAEDIINEIKAGMALEQDAVVEPDRASAITYAIRNASPDDVILIAGKGHETWQQVGDKKFPFSDQETVKTFLQGGSK